jgi:carbonic anhydrase
MKDDSIIMCGNIMCGAMRECDREEDEDVMMRKMLCTGRRRKARAGQQIERWGDREARKFSDTLESRAMVQ